jgi:hypothetical protein
MSNISEEKKAPSNFKERTIDEAALSLLEKAEQDVYWW